MKPAAALLVVGAVLLVAAAAPSGGSSSEEAIYCCRGIAAMEAATRVMGAGDVKAMGMMVSMQGTEPGPQPELSARSAVSADTTGDPAARMLPTLTLHHRPHRQLAAAAAPASELQVGVGGTSGGVRANIGEAPGPGSSSGGPISVTVGAATGRASEAVLAGGPGPNPSPGGINVTLAGAPVGSIAASPEGVSVGFSASAQPVSVSVTAGSGGHRRSLRVPLPANAASPAAAGAPAPLPAAAASVADRLPYILATLKASRSPGADSAQQSMPAAPAQASGQEVTQGYAARGAGYSDAAAGRNQIPHLMGQLPQLIIHPRCPGSAAAAGSQDIKPDMSLSPAEGPGASLTGFPPPLPVMSSGPLVAGTKAARLLGEADVHVDVPYTTVTVGSPRAGAASTNVEVHVPGRKLAAKRALAQADAAAPQYSFVPVETPQGGPAGGDVEVKPGRRLAARRALTQIGGTATNVALADPPAAPPSPNPELSAGAAAAGSCAGTAADCIVPGRKLAAARVLTEVGVVAPGTTVAVGPSQNGAAGTVVAAPGTTVAVVPSRGAAGTDVEVQVGRKLS